MPRGRRNAESNIDMTPMIDVVFQLIIFFIVTVKLDKEYNKEITLEESPHGPMLMDVGVSPLEVELDNKGRVFLNGLPLSWAELDELIRYRYNRHGEYPVIIRADKETPHRYVRLLMERLSSAGLWKLSFAAIKEYAAGNR